MLRGGGGAAAPAAAGASVSFGADGGSGGAIPDQAAHRGADPDPDTDERTGGADGSLL